MRRLTASMVMAITLALALPAAAAAPCGPLIGFAQLQAYGDNTGDGQAFVYYNGHTQVVSFDSELDLTTGIVTQQWEFDEGTVVIEETSTLTPIGGPYYRINSPVEVQPNDEGNWRYRGIWNQNTLRATFIVTGRLCIND